MSVVDTDLRASEVNWGRPEVHEREEAEARTRTCYIVSLKYAPGIFSMVGPFGRQFRQAERGSVAFLLSAAYRWMDTAGELGDAVFMGESRNLVGVIRDLLVFLLFRWARVLGMFRRKRPDVIYFPNPHPLHWAIAVMAKLCNRNCRVITHLHEPKAYRGAGSGWRQEAYEVLVERAQRIGLRLSDEVVVSSEAARRALQGAAPALRPGVHLVPLLQEDTGVKVRCERRYLTYIGAIRPRRGTRKFFDLLEASVQQGKNWHFQIVTRDDPGPYLATLSDEARQHLKVVNRPKISNEAIANALSESAACMILYELPIMQSGAVPTSLMNSTPVICTNVGGLAENLVNGEDSVILEVPVDVRSLMDAVSYVCQNGERMQKASRARFEQTFHEKNWARYYSWLLER